MHPPGPEYCQQIDSTNRRSEVGCDGLDVVKQLRALACLCSLYLE